MPRKARKDPPPPPPPSDEDDEVICVSLFHGGKLVWLPITQYIEGRLSIYIMDYDELDKETLWLKTKALGHGGLFCLYYRKPGHPLETLKLVLDDDNVNEMKTYARKNNDMIDVYVQHDFDIDFEHVGDMGEGNDSNEVGDHSDELDDMDFVDSEYSMSDQDDWQFSEYVDEDVNEAELNSSDESSSSGDSFSSLPENEYVADIEVKKKKKTFPVFKDSEDPKWEVGMIFSDHRNCREAITKHSYTQGRLVKFEKSDRTRVKAVCTPPCKWFLYASLNFDKAFQLKIVGPDHTCTREQKGLPLIHSGYLSQRYLNEFRMNPSWPIEAFHKTVMKDFSIDFKPHVLRRAKRKCLKIINGTDDEQYAKLWDYKNELLKKNPNSTVEIEMEQGVESVFKRMYICLGGLKHGFKLGCRQVVGFDGCHIKNQFKGQILTAVGVDPNNCMYPIAYAVVEAEKYESWSWFISLFIEDFNMGTGEGWTLISDRQKGLIQVVDNMLPHAEHRYCVRHMHNNFKQKYKGRSLKDKLWAAARSTNVESFTKSMEYVKEESVGAFEWLSKVPLHHWTRAHFNTEVKCDILLNNMCESFNRSIVSAREEGILVMLEQIREYLMRRLQNKRETAATWVNKYTPKTYQLLDKFKKWSGGCFAAYAGYNQFEVTTVNGSKYAVNLDRRDCGCRRWNLTGIPCHHAIACINKLGHNVENYLHACYLTSNYEKCYSGIIYPMNGQAQWIATGLHLKAPPIAKMPGRPKKKRKQEAVDELDHAIHEDGVSILTKKNQMTVRCGKCGQCGHNKRTCPTTVVKETGTSSATRNSIVDNVDEEEMRQAYHEEAAMEMQLPEDAPPLTQPSQTIAREMQNLTTEQVIKDYITFDNDDTPLAVAAKKIKKSKLVKKSDVAEEDRRATIKKEQATKIDAIKAKAQENVDGAEMHNSYTGAMRLGPPPPPPVKQYKTIVGGTTLKSAPFQSHGKTVITKGTLQAAAKLPVRRKLDGKK